MIDPAALQMVLGVLTGWLDRREREAIAYLIEENRLLRRQLGSRRLRLTDDDRRRLAARAYRVGRAALQEIATIATPGHVAAVASPVDRAEMDVRPETRTARCPAGDPSARRADGGRRIRRGVTRGSRARSQNVGHRVGRSTIRRILKAAGLPPVPQRPTSWQTFLRAHWGAIAGADFFTTEVWTWRGLVTYYTVFVIDLASRRVQILGSTPHPEALFMQQVVRTLTMAEGGAVDAPQCLICDRDRKWSGDVRRRFRDAGIRVVLTPGARAQCERVCGAVRAIDQRRMPRSDDSDRGAAFPAGRGGVSSSTTTANGITRDSTIG